MGVPTPTAIEISQSKKIECKYSKYWNQTKLVHSLTAGAASLISFFLSAGAASGGAAPSFSACSERIQSSAAFLSAAAFSNLLFFAATFVSAGDNSEAPAGASTADTESVGTDCAFSASFVASLAAFSASLADFASAAR